MGYSEQEPYELIMRDIRVFPIFEGANDVMRSYIAQTFCERAGRRVRQNFDQLERNDDERMVAIAKLAYKRGDYGYALFD